MNAPCDKTQEGTMACFVIDPVCAHLSTLPVVADGDSATSAFHEYQRSSAAARDLVLHNTYISISMHMNMSKGVWVATEDEVPLCLSIAVGQLQERLHPRSHLNDISGENTELWLGLAVRLHEYGFCGSPKMEQYETSFHCVKI